MFQHENINSHLLRQRAHNLRWATVPENVIPLTAADPDFPSAPEISEAICRFTKDRYYCYGSAEGTVEFKEAMANYFIKKRKVDANPNYIFPVDSAAFGIYITCSAFLTKNDEAIIFDPVDFLFRYSVEAAGAKALPFSIPAGTTHVNFEELEKLISEKTKMICLCNPLNPTGKVFTKDELMQLGKIACKHKLIILSDEIWSDILFKPAQFTSIASINQDIQNQTVTITGFSKSYGLAGLRIGAVLCHGTEIYQKLLNSSLHNSTVHGANILSQVAAVAALNSCEYWLNSFVNHLDGIKNIIVTELNSIPEFQCIAPEGCYVAFTNITKTGKSSQQIADFLLQEAKVAVVPGLKQWFGEGAEGHIRMSFATSEEILREALFRIKKIMI